MVRAGRDLILGVLAAPSSVARFPAKRAATLAGGSYHVVDSVVCEESAMIDTDLNKQPLNRVTAIFADSSLSFLLPRGATLKHIADCVDDLGVRRERGFIAVVVKFAATALQVPRRNWLPFRTGLLAELPRPRAFARSMACNPDRADDLVQETLAKALGTPKQVQGRHEPESLALHNTAQHLLHPIFAGSGLGSRALKDGGEPCGAGTDP